MLDNKKIPTEKAFQVYGEQEVNLAFKLLNTTPRDKHIILNHIFLDKNNFTAFPLRELEKRLKFFMDEIRSNSLRAKSLNVYIKQSPNENELLVNSEFGYNKFYLSPLPYYFLKKPNSAFIKLNYSIYNNRFPIEENSHLVKEDEISSSIEYSANNSKLSYNLSNKCFLSTNLGDVYELETKFKKSKSDKDIKRRQTQGVFKTILSKNFNERPFVFRENLIYDDVNKLSLQYSHKLIKNYLDEFNCSPRLISDLPLEDSQHHLKLFYTWHKADFDSKNVSYFKAGSSLINTLNSTYLRNKIFFRKLFIYEPFTYQLNIEAGNVTSLKDKNENLRIHEKLFVNNFRGIENPSPKILTEEGKNIKINYFIYLGKTGDSLGNLNYILLANKILLTNIPVFNNFNLINDGLQISPFLHFNLLWTPFSQKNQKSFSKNLENEVESETKINDLADLNNIRISSGFGVSLITQAFAIEFYYNTYLKKESYDVGREFFIKFGID